MNKIWFEDGKLAATEADLNPDEEFLECPWPIYTEEGASWLRGWNSIAKENEEICCRPGNRGWLFEPNPSEGA